MIISAIDFKKPRQKMWGILKTHALTMLPFGHETDEKGDEITGYATNCYDDALAEAHTLLASGIGSANIQVIEFVPYDYIMQPRV
ncbi:hypothetical protein [Clostridium estertheticum]|uniref:Uncharacterized protein n=1 Tax=Clostridium estertheticum TaxID=238834 RepID=A0AA47EJC6_9CLOT|nr:hypothetical protein [Clostridium estertheticum]MBU3155192.1 hypothetical protein [Clostridium estertheticum]WAG61246.1 hypothetical protein LL038_03060 [Clostridium estertheticum]